MFLLLEGVFWWEGKLLIVGNDSGTAGLETGSIYRSDLTRDG